MSDHEHLVAADSGVCLLHKMILAELSPGVDAPLLPARGIALILNTGLFSGLCEGCVELPLSRIPQVTDPSDAVSV